MRGHGGYLNPEFIGPGSSAWELGYTTDVITDNTIELMKRAMEDSAQFMVMGYCKAPHAP